LQKSKARSWHWPSARQACKSMLSHRAEACMTKPRGRHL
jgi:hypothetical protein